MSNTTVSHSYVCSTDNLGGMVYPFLKRFPQWVIRTRTLGGPLPGDPIPTLTWVKDTKVLDLFIPEVDMATFLSITGLRFDMEKGPFVLSKRISRIMRPYRFYEFFPEDELLISFDPTMDEALWDGCALISPELLGKVKSTMIHNLLRTGRDIAEAKLYADELTSTDRWELTVLHKDGQEKAHAMVREDLQVDIVVPAGATKRDVSLYNNAVFIGLQPVHADETMRVDIQSLINLYPFFDVDHLVQWQQDESELYIEHIRGGVFDEVIGRLWNVKTADQLTQMRQWLVGEYLLSGGKTMWFPGIIRAMMRQYEKRLQIGLENMRFPVPGGRFYIFPAAVGNINVPPGHIELDPPSATAWVNDDDWLSYIVGVLGGCDGDDALWIVPFNDLADSECKILAWRSPNQLGEYVLLKPTLSSYELAWETVHGFDTWPFLDSRNLPPRIDQVGYTYGQLSPFDRQWSGMDYFSAMYAAAADAQTNAMMLGAYCNALMLIRATYGKLSTHLPARLEDVIDGSVKSPVDLTPVMEWIRMAGKRIAKQRKPVAPSLHVRMPAQHFQYDTNHWLEHLINSMRDHLAMFQAAARAVELEAQIPMSVFENGREWSTVGASFVQRYRHLTRIYRGDFDKIQLELMKSVKPGLMTGTLAGAASHIYAHDLKDSVLWLLDFEDGSSGVGRAWLNVLRDYQLIGEPVWTRQGAENIYQVETVEIGVPVRVNGVWLNLDDEARGIASRVGFAGYELYPHEYNGRVVLRTADGSLFGYVQKGHEARLRGQAQWSVTWSNMRQGDVYAVLC